MSKYEPVILDFPDAGVCEFVIADRATFTRSAGNYDELVDMETGRVIGFMWPIGTFPRISPLPPPSGHPAP